MPTEVWRITFNASLFIQASNGQRLLLEFINHGDAGRNGKRGSPSFAAFLLLLKKALNRIKESDSLFLCELCLKKATYNVDNGGHTNSSELFCKKSFWFCLVRLIRQNNQILKHQAVTLYCIFSDCLFNKLYFELFHNCIWWLR